MNAKGNVYTARIYKCFSHVLILLYAYLSVDWPYNKMKLNAMHRNPNFLTVFALLSFVFPLWNAESFSAIDLIRKIMQSSWCHHNNVRRLEKHMRHWKWLKHQAEKRRRDRLEERTNTVNEKKRFWMDYCTAFKNATEEKHMRICCILFDLHIRVLHACACMWCEMETVHWHHKRAQMKLNSRETVKLALSLHCLSGSHAFIHFRHNIFDVSYFQWISPFYGQTLSYVAAVAECISLLFCI